MVLVSQRTSSRRTLRKWILPNYDITAAKKSCHPKCRWTCGTGKNGADALNGGADGTNPNAFGANGAGSAGGMGGGGEACNSLCSPRCKPPVCVTGCKKMSLAGCKRTCKDPVCAVVCPPQCEHGTCPKCKTICGPSICELSCGKAACSSTCADPKCV